MIIPKNLISGSGISPVEGTMVWKGLYDGSAYTKDDVVRDGYWTMIANVDTNDRPAPQPSGVPENTLPDNPAWSSQSNLSSVITGHTYTFLEDGWVKELRVWVPEVSATTSYRFVILDTTIPSVPKSEIIGGSKLVANSWNTLAVGASIVPAGSVISVYIEAINSGSSTNISGGWTYYGTDNNNPPLPQGWNTDNPRTLVRLDKTDLDSIDRSSELAGVIGGSSIRFVETANPLNFVEYSTIDSPTLVGDTYEYPVILTGVGGEIPLLATCTVDIDVPVPQSTSYTEITGYWASNEPTWASVDGFKRFNDVPQPSQEDVAFGVDIEFQKAYISPAWDLVATAITTNDSSSGLTTDQLSWLGVNAKTEGGWKDNIQYFSAARGGGTTEPIWSDMGNGIYNWLFTSGDELFVYFHVTHDYKLGSMAYPHIHFLVTNAMTAGQQVSWSFNYVIAKGHHQGESLTVAEQTIPLVYTADGTEVAGEHLIVECTDLEAFDLIEPDAIVCARVALDSENVSGNIFGLLCDLHYQSDRDNTPNKVPDFYS